MATNISRARRSVRSAQSSSSSVGDKPATRPASKAASLPRRLLFPQLPADAEPPPLLVFPSATPALNAELYEFIALALRAYVNPWWTKITRYDKEFLPTITRIFTAVIRALETRLVSADLTPLFFRDLPALVTQHYVDFRNAKSKLHTSYASGGAATLPQLFHHLQPHMAVNSDGQISDVYVRQAIDQILKACLPPEDYESEAERYIVREIVLSVLLRNVLPRVTQPWFIQKLMLDNLVSERHEARFPERTDPLQTPPTTLSDKATVPRNAFSLQSLAIYFFSTVQTISGACLALIHAYRQARDTIRKVNQSSPSLSQQSYPGSAGPSTPRRSTENTTATLSPIPTPFVPGGLTIVTAPDGIPSHPHAPPTPTSISSLDPMRRSSSSSTVRKSSTSSTPPIPSHAAASIPVCSDYAHPPLTMLLTLLSPPPLSASTAMAQSTPTASTWTSLALTYTLSLPLTFFEPFVSRLLPYLLYTYVLSASRLTEIVRATRRALFPEGWPGPTPPEPTPEEQVAIRTELRRRLLAAVPVPLAVFLGPTPEARAYTIDAMLDPLSSQACNAHLTLFILDLVLLTVFPELGASETAAAAVTEGSVDRPSAT